MTVSSHKESANTSSVCPVCLKRLPAAVVRRGLTYFLEKECSDHGRFSTVVWRGENPRLEDWGNYMPPDEPAEEQPDCPSGCGLCAGHLQKTCCVVVEVTQRCDLKCGYCFAQSGDGSTDPSVAQLSASFRALVENGNTFVQLSGGEPTVRNDLPEIVAAARDAGCENIQLNSNGVRLGKDRGFVKALAEAGLSFVFMQFDGLDDRIYESLRGRPLKAEKLAAIDACAAELLGVTLVPTIVPGVNDQHIGAILDFALSKSPAVRGVHFQPVSYFGRYPQPPRDSKRVTLPEVLSAIEEQTSGKIRIADLVPSGCDHPRCGFHGDFVILPDSILPLTSKTGSSCCQAEDSHLKNRNFVARRWKRTTTACEESCCGEDYTEMDTFLARIKSHGFTITGMAFQDAYTLDIERLRRCSLHVFDNGNLIPFCARYLTPSQG